MTKLRKHWHEASTRSKSLKRYDSKLSKAGKDDQHVGWHLKGRRETMSTKSSSGSLNIGGKISSMAIVHKFKSFKTSKKN